MNPSAPPTLRKEAISDSARLRRILFRAMIATLFYAVIVVVWPRLWRRGLQDLGGVWLLLIVIYGGWPRLWRSTLPQIYEQAKMGNLRIGFGQRLLALAAICLITYGMAGNF
jgi:hypothetical protein